MTVDEKTERRFWAKVEYGPGCCMTWTARKSKKGYGGFRVGSRSKRRMLGAHVWAYQQYVGDIPAGMEVHHTCCNPSCVNPEHLEAVTHRENVLRGDTVVAANARKTHCPRGHPYDRRRPNGSRRCSTCGRDQMWQSKARLWGDPERIRQRERDAGLVSLFD